MDSKDSGAAAFQHQLELTYSSPPNIESSPTHCRKNWSDNKQQAGVNTKHLSGRDHAEGRIPDNRQDEG